MNQYPLKWIKKFKLPYNVALSPLIDEKNSDIDQVRIQSDIKDDEDRFGSYATVYTILMVGPNKSLLIGNVITISKRAVRNHQTSCTYHFYQL